MNNEMYEIKIECGPGIQVHVVEGIQNVDRYETIYSKANSKVFFNIERMGADVKDHPILYIVLNSRNESIELNKNCNANGFIHVSFTMPDSNVRIIAVDALDACVNWPKDNRTEHISHKEKILITMNNYAENGNIFMKSVDGELINLRDKVFDTISGTNLELHIVPDEGYTLKNSLREQLFCIDGLRLSNAEAYNISREGYVYEITAPSTDLYLNPIFVPLEKERHSIFISIKGYRTKIHDMTLFSSHKGRHINPDEYTISDAMNPDNSATIISCDEYEAGSDIEILVWIEEGFCSQLVFEWPTPIDCKRDLDMDPITINRYGKDINIVPYQYKFVMPNSNININLDILNIESQLNDDIVTIEAGIVDYFTIPDELAKELSSLLIRQTVRERLLSQVINDPTRYEKAEEMLIPITSKIEAIKTKITKEFVPEKYNSAEYIWNYDGYTIDGNKVQILRSNAR